VGSHAAALRGQGVSQELVDAIATNNLKNSSVAQKDLALLKFVRILTLEPATVKDADVQSVRQAGWTDEQIWEAALETSFFAFFNRMADAFGLDYPTMGWMPPAVREKLDGEQKKDPPGPVAGKP